MATVRTLRAIVPPLIAVCGLVGGYAGMYQITKNGFGESLADTAGRATDPYIAGGVHPFKNSYTGIPAVDAQLLVLVSFFAYMLDTPQSWAVTASFWYLLVQFFAACCLLFLEGLRRGNAGRLVTWTGTMGFLCQNFSYTIIAPIYCILHIFTSPTASPSVSARDVLPAEAAEPGILLLSNAIAFFVPALGMVLPSPSVVSAATHYNWIATWQFFPLLYSLFQWTFTHLFPPARLSPSARPALTTAIIYRAVLTITIASHLALLAISLTPASIIPPGYPTVSRLFTEITLPSALIPPSLSSPPTVDPHAVPPQPLAPLAHFFLVWDVYCGSVALLLWAVYLRCVVAPADGRGWTGLVVRTLGWSVVGGPVAAAAGLLWERDEALVRREGLKKKV